MKQYYPDYFFDFSCPPGGCSHSCCVGWEIDIDEDTLALYRSLEGELGGKIRKSIAFENGCASFILDENERCPFLKEDGCCEIICEKGKDALCSICSDHPRFRSFFKGRTETGLGLCCERAARLVLGTERRVKLICADEDEAEENGEYESLIISLRDNLVSALQERELTLEERIGKILSICHTRLPDVPPREWADLLEKMEELDRGRRKYLLLIRRAKQLTIPGGFDIPLEQFGVYLLTRHIPGAADDGMVKERCLLAAAGILLAGTALAECEERSFDTLCDIVRVFSSEIEYSEENTDAFLEFLSR